MQQPKKQKEEHCNDGHEPHRNALGRARDAGCTIPNFSPRANGIDAHSHKVTFNASITIFCHAQGATNLAQRAVLSLANSTDTCIRNGRSSRFVAKTFVGSILCEAHSVRCAGSCIVADGRIREKFVVSHRTIGIAKPINLIGKSRRARHLFQAQSHTHKAQTRFILKVLADTFLILADRLSLADRYTDPKK